MSDESISRNEQEIFQDLQRLCGSPGYVHALAAISHRDNFISYIGPMTGEVMAASYGPERTIRTEFSTLMGLMLKQPLDFENPGAQAIQGMLARTDALLQELHACLNQPMIQALVRAAQRSLDGVEPTQLNPFIRADVLREPIFYGGESAFSFQYRDLAKERYSRDDGWLLTNMGFSIADSHRAANGIVTLLNSKLLSQVHPPARTPSDTVLPGFSFYPQELAEHSGLPIEPINAFLAAFTAPTPPTNDAFATLSDFNIANARPLLRTDEGEYIALQSYNVDESLYESPFFWMAEDPYYKNQAFTNRGIFTEEFTGRRLRSVFGNDAVFNNVEIYDGSKRLGEIDVLVIWGDRALVLQCKSKRLTIEARKGNDLQLRTDFKKAVQASYDQAHRCALFLQTAGLSFRDANGVIVAIPYLKKIYPICVVSDHYPALTVQAREFLSFSTDERILPPLVTDVFLIDVLTEMLSSPLWLLSYLNRRANYREKITAINELTVLSYHLKQNLWVGDDMDFVMLADDVAIDLDTAFTVRRQGIEGTLTPEGILTHLGETLVGRILHAIERRPKPELIDLGFMLLTLSGDTLDQLEHGLKEISSQTRRDGQRHDFTLAFGDSGLTVHCSTGSNQEALERLADHCRLRKYAHRADSWFGLVVRASDGLPKFGLNLSFPWSPDTRMAEATKGMSLRGNFRKGTPWTATPKIGRNQPCPCGSGKKFKRCCLNNAG